MTFIYLSLNYLLSTVFFYWLWKWVIVVTSVMKFKSLHYSKLKEFCSLGSVYSIIADCC